MINSFIRKDYFINTYFEEIYAQKKALLCRKFITAPLLITIINLLINILLIQAIRSWATGCLCEVLLQFPLLPSL